MIMTGSKVAGLRVKGLRSLVPGWSLMSSPGAASLASVDPMVPLCKATTNFCDGLAAACLMLCLLVVSQAVARAPC